MPRGSELCRPYHPLSRCTPSTIYPLSRPTPTNWVFVSLINHYVPTAMEVDTGTVVLALVLDTLSGRSPLHRLEEFFAQQDTELLLGKTVPPQALNDDTAGRVLDRLYDFGTMRLFTACAVRRPRGLAWSAAMCTLIRPPAVSGATTSLPRHRICPFR